jgi:hypothetical protein
VHTLQGVNHRLRLATRKDEPVLQELIARSIRGLGANDYAPEQIEAALLNGTQLVARTGAEIRRPPTKSTADSQRLTRIRDSHD